MLFLLFRLGYDAFVNIGAFCQTISTALVTGLVTGQYWHIPGIPLFPWSKFLWVNHLWDKWELECQGLLPARAVLHRNNPTAPFFQCWNFILTKVYFNLPSTCRQERCEDENTSLLGVVLLTEDAPIWGLSLFRPFGANVQSFNSTRSCLSPAAALWSRDFGNFGTFCCFGSSSPHVAPVECSGLWQLLLFPSL